MKGLIGILTNYTAEETQKAKTDYKQVFLPFDDLLFLNWGIVSFRVNWRPLVLGGYHPSFALLCSPVHWQQKNVFLTHVNALLVRDQV